ncbi:ARID domain-containing protein [Mycena venus]|uniref:ARID domain-containing protein n=1 Tax=Mycena venus TaxID=2733690 RepID=A0A8H7DFE2_9AGAR|nr:ARID domain-containing protein [Mycena venus]
MNPSLGSNTVASITAGQPPHVTRTSFTALTERAQKLKNIITNQERELVQLTSQRSRIGDASFMDKVRTVSADLKTRKEHYARLVSFLHRIKGELQENGQISVIPSHATAEQPPHVTRASFNALTERAQNLKNIITNQETQLVQLTSQRSRIGDAAFMDKVRTVSADLKIRKEHYTRLVNFLHQIEDQRQENGHMNDMEVGMPANRKGWHFPPIPPLEKSRFDTLYKDYCAQHSIVHNPRMMSIEMRPLDLHDLHTQVIFEGGASNVTLKDSWSVSRQSRVPGLPSISRTSTREYLAAFDNVYVSTVTIERQNNDVLVATGDVGGNSGPERLLGGIADPSGPVQVDQPPFGGPPGHMLGMNNEMIPPGQTFGKMQCPMKQNPMDIQQSRPPQQLGIAQPCREHLQAAMAHIAKLKSDYNPERTFHILSSLFDTREARRQGYWRYINVPVEQRME